VVVVVEEVEEVDVLVDVVVEDVVCEVDVVDEVCEVVTAVIGSVEVTRDVTVLPAFGVSLYWHILDSDPVHVSMPENVCDPPGCMSTFVKPGLHDVSDEGAVCVHAMLVIGSVPIFLITTVTELLESENVSTTSIP